MTSSSRARAAGGGTGVRRRGYYPEHKERTMITKQRAPRNHHTRVTFALQQPDARTISIAGDFTDWQASKEMRRSGEGLWRVSVELPSGREYGFRYLVNGERWINDPAADKYVPNPFGSENSVVVT
ncbi:MAG TPA: isoamylase early set domain-containing protein [Gemmatimonadales bacterium]|nr:isoamylase early set domain-containing protein [Gemmatimonadales bacterium]